MFKNISKEIKDDLAGDIFLSTVVSIFKSIVIVLIVLILVYGLTDSTEILKTALVISPIAVIFSGIMSYFKAKKEVMYRYAFGELVEAVCNINEQLSPKYWTCPNCQSVNQQAFGHCYHCGYKKP